MPFGGWFDKCWQQVYQPAIEAAQLRPRRADDLFRSSNIVEDIWRFTKEADVLLAELSTRNSNVFYELGLAHAIAKPAVLVSSSMDDIPFDLQGLRVVVYDRDDPSWGSSLRRRITTALVETLSDPDAAVPSTFVEAPTPSKKTVLTAEDKELLQLRQDVEFSSVRCLA